MNKGKIKKRLELTCNFCSKTFKVLPSKKYRKFCSSSCFEESVKKRGYVAEWTESRKKAMSEKYKGEGNPMFGKKHPSKGKIRVEMRGKNHPCWKGGKTINKEGYIIIENIVETSGKKKREHRLILEEALGRELKPTEIVHHLNGIKTDNSLGNLILVDRAEHIKIHKKDLLKGRGL
jgi:ribosomal protein L31